MTGPVSHTTLALGLDRHPRHYDYPKGNPGLVSRFAKKVTDPHEVLAYPEVVARKGLRPAEVGPELEVQILSLMREAEHIHFQLDGMIGRGHGKRLQPRQVQSLREALARGEFGTAIPNNVTNWEFYQVFHNFRAKASCYWKSKVVDLSNALD